MNTEILGSVLDPVKQNSSCTVKPSRCSVRLKNFTKIRRQRLRVDDLLIIIPNDKNGT